MSKDPVSECIQTVSSKQRPISSKMAEIIVLAYRCQYKKNQQADQQIDPGLKSTGSIWFYTGCWLKGF